MFRFLHSYIHPDFRLQRSHSTNTQPAPEVAPDKDAVQRFHERFSNPPPENQDAHFAKILGLKGKMTRSEVKARYFQLVEEYKKDQSHRGQEPKPTLKEIHSAFVYFRKKYGMDTEA